MLTAHLTPKKRRERHWALQRRLPDATELITAAPMMVYSGVSEICLMDFRHTSHMRWSLRASNQKSRANKDKSRQYKSTLTEHSRLHKRTMSIAVSNVLHLLSHLASGLRGVDNALAQNKGCTKPRLVTYSRRTRSRRTPEYPQDDWRAHIRYIRGFFNQATTYCPLARSDRKSVV